MGKGWRSTVTAILSDEAVIIELGGRWGASSSSVCQFIGRLRVSDGEGDCCGDESLTKPQKALANGFSGKLRTLRVSGLLLHGSPLGLASSSVLDASWAYCVLRIANSSVTSRSTHGLNRHQYLWIVHDYYKLTLWYALDVSLLLDVAIWKWMAVEVVNKGKETWIDGCCGNVRWPLIGWRYRSGHDGLCVIVDNELDFELDNDWSSNWTRQASGYSICSHFPVFKMSN